MTLELVEEMLASCRRGDRLRLRFLLSLDPTLVIGSSMDGTTCLHVACSAGDEATIDILLDKGANVRYVSQLLSLISDNLQVHARTVDGSTPLCEAAAGGWANVITKLIDRGATVNPPCQLVSALHEAAQNGKNVAMGFQFFPNAFPFQAEPNVVACWSTLERIWTNRIVGTEHRCTLRFTAVTFARRKSYQTRVRYL